jgi:hypothetical protein
MATFAYDRQGRLERYYDRLWTEYFGRPTDEYPGRSRLVEILKEGFFEGDWWFAFDIFEIVLEMENEMGFHVQLAAKSISDALTGSAYMLLNRKFVERLPDEQIESVRAALAVPFSTVSTHFKNAFAAWCRRPEPDAGEVVRESIHGVEATCRELCGDQNADLTKALAKLGKERPFHPALKQAIEKLYAWTSDESGLRHSLKGNPLTKAEKAEAQLALVTCSAIANYLISR